MSDNDNKNNNSEAMARGVESVIAIGANKIASYVGIPEIVTTPAITTINSFFHSNIKEIIDLCFGDFEKRSLSPIEEKRIKNYKNKVEIKVTEKIQGLIDGNIQDCDISINNNATKKEITEATFLLVQKEYEERKIPYIENFYTNIIFDNSIERNVANALVRIIGEMSYQQILILACIGNSEKEKQAAYNVEKFNDKQYSDSDWSIEFDVRNLFQKSIINPKDGIVVDINCLDKSVLALKGLGEKLYKLMELDTLTEANIDYKKILDFFNR